ncbi:MAG: DUF1189 family protein [Patescibacteria group bacterium]
MIATFKETLASLQDLKYGQTIIKKTVGQALWYWTKYYLLLTAISLFIAVAALTYFVPQVSKFLSQKLPQDLAFTIKDGKLSSPLKQPLVYEDSGVTFILDTTGKIKDLSDYKTGVLASLEKIVFKDQQSQLKEVLYKDFGNFQFNRDIAVDWATKNKGVLWGAGLGLFLLLALFYGGFLYIYHLIVVLASAFGLRVLSLVLRKKLSYPDTLKIVFYASVLPLLVSAASFLSPSQDISFLIQLGLFLLYSIGWLWYLKK